MTALAISFRQPVLQWATSAEDEERYRRIWRSLVARSEEHTSELQSH